jgi:hypothetical protein
MKAYIYHVETNQIAVVILGDNNKDIEREIQYQNYDTDVFGVTYSQHGLHTMYDTEFVDVTGSYE